MEIVNNIDDCMVYNYAHAQAGEFDYLYADKKKHGKGTVNEELINALIQINEELEDGTVPMVYTVSRLEILKLQINQLEWALKLLHVGTITNKREEIVEVLKEARLPFKQQDLINKLGALRTKFRMDKDTYNKEVENGKKNPFKVGDILNNVSVLNIVLEGNYIDAKKTSMRDFSNYNKVAKSKIDNVKKR